MSGMPLLMFALFLSLYISTEFLPVFPARIQRVTKYTLILCVPLIVVLNALASFLNLRYGSLHRVFCRRRLNELPHRREALESGPPHPWDQVLGSCCRNLPQQLHANHFHRVPSAQLGSRPAQASKSFHKSVSD